MEGEYGSNELLAAGRQHNRTHEKEKIDVAQRTVHIILCFKELVNHFIK